jgi:hypothetical protein
MYQYLEKEIKRERGKGREKRFKRGGRGNTGRNETYFLSHVSREERVCSPFIHVKIRNLGIISQNLLMLMFWAIHSIQNVVPVTASGLSPGTLHKTRVVDPDPDWIRIQRLCGSGSVLGIRIQGQENEEISKEKCTLKKFYH